MSAINTRTRKMKLKKSGHKVDVDAVVEIFSLISALVESSPDVFQAIARCAHQACGKVGGDYYCPGEHKDRLVELGLLNERGNFSDRTTPEIIAEITEHHPSSDDFRFKGGEPMNHLK